MKNSRRRYKVTKPGKSGGKTETEAEGKTRRKTIPSVRSGPVKGKMNKGVKTSSKSMPDPGFDKRAPGRSVRVVTKPGNIPGDRKRFPAAAGAKPAISPKPKPEGEVKPGPGGRKYRVVTPGQQTVGKPEVQRSAAPAVKSTGKVSVKSPGKGRTPPRPAKKKGKPGPAKKQIDGPLSATEMAVLKGFDRGPASLHGLSKRTKIPLTKLIPITKKLSEGGLLISKKVGRVKKFKLSEQGDLLLHPRKFPMTLFKRKRRKRRRGRRRKLSRRQRIRRLDMAITAVFIAIMITVTFVIYLALNIGDIQDNNSDNRDNSNLVNDKTDPIILWENQRDTINIGFGSIEYNFIVFDPGENPSGIDRGTIRVQYAFASTPNFSNPNLTNWTSIVPIIPDDDRPNVWVRLDRTWMNYNGYYFYLKFSVRDNAGNSVVEIYKILIDVN